MIREGVKRQTCEAGHKSHERLEVETDLGLMTVFNWNKYRSQPGFYCTGQDDVSRTLFNEGTWEKEQTKLIGKILKEGNKKNLVIDVGSHVGWYSRMASQFGYEVEAFEGDIENVEVFKLNAPKANIHTIWFDKDLEGVFDLDKDVELMKIDIEGAEEHVIRYFASGLNRVKHLIMEISPVFNDSYPGLIRILQDFGFKVLELDGKPFDFNFDFKQRDLYFKR